MALDVQCIHHAHQQVGSGRFSVCQADVVGHHVQNEGKDYNEYSCDCQSNGSGVHEPPGIVCHEVQGEVHACHGLRDMVTKDPPPGHIKHSSTKLADETQGGHVDPDICGGGHGHEEDHVGHGNENNQDHPENGRHSHLNAVARLQQLADHPVVHNVHELFAHEDTRSYGGHSLGDVEHVPFPDGEIIFLYAVVARLDAVHDHDDNDERLDQECCDADSHPPDRNISMSGPVRIYLRWLDASDVGLEALDEAHFCCHQHFTGVVRYQLINFVDK
mmetsp:Transcript_49614/g.115010  ORF Transcript_49614/g.115010 Transcript_49614/m.115010 type:complete len:274 (+) Transcript_49614:62-883(+)